MKKQRKHKWKYRINHRRKILVLVILGVSLFVGIGYSIVGSNLGIGGTLEVDKYEKTLYAALKREVVRGNALKYTGAHQDSMDPSKSTEDIYHYYAANKDKGLEVSNRNNVLFANICWKMIRTTDTGGVRLLYYGIPDTIEVNGESRLNCGEERSEFYHLGETRTTLDLNGTYIFAKNYNATFNGENAAYTLIDDPNDPNDYKSITINSSNAATKIAEIVANYPYTCASSSSNCSNLRFYKVDSFVSGTKVLVYSAVEYHSLGRSEFVPQYNSPAYVGYMYGDAYTEQTLTATTTQSLATTQTVLSTTSFAATYKYSKVLNLTGTSTVYELDNPVLGSDITDPDYSGYYTYRSATTVSGAQPYYLAGRNGTGQNYYYVRLSSTRDLASYNLMIGTDLEDNGDNTYTIKNGTSQATEVTPRDWYSNYASYSGKYTCGTATDTCTSPRYITSATITNFTYINVLGKISISTERTGTQLSGDVETITMKQWYEGYNTTYSNYRYTCGNTNTTCTEANLRYIISKASTYYTYALNRYFGASVIYEDNVYKLQNTIPLENTTSLENLSTHHYTCVSPGLTQCAQVAFVYYYAGSGSMKYIALDDANITSGEAALEEMLTSNKTDSAVKREIDIWYENKILNTEFESKLDDTIYCVDRSYSTVSGYTFNESGWNSNGGYMNKLLYFKEKNVSTDLSCTNLTDRFSVSNNAAHLTYKIGLPSAPEINIINTTYAIDNDGVAWLASPSGFYNDYGASVQLISRLKTGYEISEYNSAVGLYTLFAPLMDIIDPVQPSDVRPVISLIAGTKYSSGNGSATNPYIVDMSE